MLAVNAIVIFDRFVATENGRQFVTATDTGRQFVPGQLAAASCLWIAFKLEGCAELHDHENEMCSHP